jgi:hypothetical protein
VSESDGAQCWCRDLGSLDAAGHFSNDAVAFVWVRPADTGKLGKLLARHLPGQRQLRNTGVKFQDLIKARRLKKKIDERVLNFGWGHIACV